MIEVNGDKSTIKGPAWELIVEVGIVYSQVFKALTNIGLPADKVAEKMNEAIIEVMKEDFTDENNRT